MWKAMGISLLTAKEKSYVKPEILLRILNQISLAGKVVVTLKIGKTHCCYLKYYSSYHFP